MIGYLGLVIPYWKWHTQKSPAEWNKEMRFYEFAPISDIEQARAKSLKQQAKQIQIKQKQQRLQKQRERAAATAAQITKLQNKSP